MKIFQSFQYDMDRQNKTLTVNDIKMQDGL